MIRIIRELLDILSFTNYGKIISGLEKSDYKEFKTRKEAAKWGEEHYLDWSKKYKKNMKVADGVINNSCISQAIECYCGHSYRGINDYLRSTETKDTSSINKEMANIMAMILSMAPRIPNNIVVYRLVCDEFINDIIQNNKKEIPTCEKGFISTSMTTDIVKCNEHYSNLKNLLKIYVKSGTIGIYVNGITKRSEEEVLLFPNGFFKLIKKPYKGSNNKRIFETELYYFDHQLK